MEISAFGNILLFMLGGIMFALLGLATSRLIAPHRPNPEKNTTYECGEDPEGSARIQFNMRYYLPALIFLLFEVEAIFLFPWAVVFGSPGEHTGDSAVLYIWGEGILFLMILAAGLWYAWSNGDLDWNRPEPVTGVSPSPYLTEDYDIVNQKYAGKIRQ